MKKNKGELLLKANRSLAELRRSTNYIYYGLILAIIGAILVLNDVFLGIWIASLGGLLWFLGMFAKLLASTAESIIEGLDGNIFDVDIYEKDIETD